MRIIKGSLKGRKVNAPKNLPVRPTTDFAREALLSLLEHEGVLNETTSFLDLFSGTGMISYELASCGIKEITCVDIHQDCINFIKTAAEHFELPIKAIRCSASRFIKMNKTPYDLVFADPPYDIEQLRDLPKWVLESTLLHDESLFVLEHPEQYNFTEHPKCFKTKRYGRVHFSFFRKSTQKENSLELTSL